ncbi:hypothetical protein MHU86_6893 [Fragilaria crotonensis]|nr:hypothetical protein MHU86_6893 [Fragilaria crotonensis]
MVNHQDFADPMSHQLIGFKASQLGAGVYPSFGGMRTRQAGRVWNKHLIEKLKKVGFVASRIDECLQYRGGQSVFVLYTNDSILAGPDSKELDSIIEDMKKAELDLTVEGDIADFLGVNIERSEDGKNFNLTQPHLIDDILKELRLEADKTAIKRTTGPSRMPLLRCPNAEPFDGASTTAEE